jgi:PAS domain S-box-containing protein
MQTTLARTMEMITLVKWVRRHRRLALLLPWGGLSASLLVAIWAVTKSRQAPQLILLALLYLITVNFSVPLRSGGVGLMPLVSVSSLLVVGLQAAVWTLVISILLAELAHPLWEPVRESIGSDISPSGKALRAKLGRGLVLLLGLHVAGSVLENLVGRPPHTGEDFNELRVLVSVTLGYGTPYVAGSYLLWLIGDHREGRFPVPLTLAVGTMLHPFAFLGGIVFWRSGLPLFVVFCLGVAAASLAAWLFWQRSFVIQQRLIQFGLLNEVAQSLRETLDLDHIMTLTRKHVAELIPADQHDILLLDDENEWHQPLRAESAARRTGGSSQQSDQSHLPPDELTRWVVQNHRLLELNRSNMHFAEAHGLALPLPAPAAWLGVPLIATDRAVGAIVLQRQHPAVPFDVWNREMLLAIAVHSAAAIQNALAYDASVRRYYRTDEALARRIEQLRALLFAMKDGVLMVDIHARIVLVNPRAGELLGQNSDDLQGQVLDAEHYAGNLGFDRRELVSRLASLAAGRAFDAQTATFETDYLINDDGTARRFLQRADAPVLAASGEVIGWLILFRDVSDEQELAELRADLSRMVVHDLRNPLTTLASTIDLIESRLQSVSPRVLSEVSELFYQARRSGSDMLDMVDSLMEISQMEAGQTVLDAEAMHFGTLVERVVARLRPLAAQKQIELRFQNMAELPLVWADAEMIRRVLTNLLDNALKYTPAGGNITVNARREQIADAPTESGILCVIRDSGPGIPPEYRDNLFDRHMRTNQGGAQVRGTGIGLTFCKMAVEAHGGRIWVEDPVDGGGCFVFTLPGIPFFDIPDDEDDP